MKLEFLYTKEIPPAWKSHIKLQQKIPEYYINTEDLTYTQVMYGLQEKPQLADNLKIVGVYDKIVGNPTQIDTTIAEEIINNPYAVGIGSVAQSATAQEITKKIYKSKMDTWFNETQPVPTFFNNINKQEGELMYLIIPNPDQLDQDTLAKNTHCTNSENKITAYVDALMKKGWGNVHVYTLTCKYQVPKMPKPIKYNVTKDGEVLPA